MKIKWLCGLVITESGSPKEQIQKARERLIEQLAQLNKDQEDAHPR